MFSEDSLWLGSAKNNQHLLSRIAQFILIWLLQLNELKLNKTLMSLNRTCHSSTALKKVLSHSFPSYSATSAPALLRELLFKGLPRLVSWLQEHGQIPSVSPTGERWGFASLHVTGLFYLKVLKVLSSEQRLSPEAWHAGMLYVSDGKLALTEVSAIVKACLRFLAV